MKITKQHLKYMDILAIGFTFFLAIMAGWYNWFFHNLVFQILWTFEFASFIAYVSMRLMKLH